MKTNIDCIPCFTRHALEASRNIGLEPSQSKFLMKEVLALLQKMDWDSPPPVMGRDIHRLIRKISNCSDPYARQKSQNTQEALHLLPKLEQRVQSSTDIFLTAVQFSIAGNAIDLGAKTMEQVNVEKIFDSAQNAPIDSTMLQRLKTAITSAQNVLFLADNAGEIVFDIPLLEQIGKEKLTVVVRGKPCINDATLEDAARSGISQRFHTVSNGADTPGTWLQDCSDEFVQLFEKADLVLAKGQGNYETLNDTHQRVFFLFMAKCDVIAQDAMVPLNSYVLWESNHDGKKKSK